MTVTVSVLCFFLAVPWVGLQCVIEEFLIIFTNFLVVLVIVILVNIFYVWSRLSLGSQGSCHYNKYLDVSVKKNVIYQITNMK